MELSSINKLKVIASSKLGVSKSEQKEKKDKATRHARKTTKRLTSIKEGKFWFIYPTTIKFTLTNKN